MECTETLSHLHEYVDREIDAVTALAIDEHLQTCAACKQAYAQQAALQTATRQHAAYYRAPDALANRIRGELAPRRDSILMKFASHTPWYKLVGAVAATAVITWIAALQFASTPADERLADEVIAGHVRSVLTNHVTDVASSDQHTVKPWLSSKLDFSPPVSDLTPVGYPLVGGRLDYLDHRTVAVVVYHHRQHVINLFVWPEADSRAASMRSVSSQGYNLLHWNSGGMTYRAISDVNPAEMKAFADALAEIK